MEKIVIEFEREIYCFLFNSIELKLLGFSDRFLVCEDLKTGSEYLISKRRFDEIKARDVYGNITIPDNEYYKEKLKEYYDFEKTIPFYENIWYAIICIVDIFYDIITYPGRCTINMIKKYNK